MLPGWEVTRLIPVETLVGLISGQYKLYGGVIRHAAGTPQAGQIVIDRKLKDIQKDVKAIQYFLESTA